MTIRKHELAKCEECPLLEAASFCPSDGPDSAEIVIVGEAPGHKEAKDGKPFIGASGQVLNQLLEHNGIKREDVFITNTVLCRPAGNANPPADAVEACGARLRREIEDREPNTILALGNFASRKLLATSQGITTLRVGPPKVSKQYPGVRIIPTFHPAATLYNPGSFPDLVKDFGKINGTSITATSNWSPPHFEVVDDRDAAIKAIETLLQRGSAPLAVDIEVGIDKDVDTVHPAEYRLLCIGLGHDYDSGLVVGENACRDELVVDRLRRLFGQARLICHNGKFDIQGLLGLGVADDRTKLWFDTMLASYAMDERRGIHSLEYNAIERLGSPSWKHEVGHYLGPDKNYTDIPRPVLYRYNAYDVVNTYRLWRSFDGDNGFTDQLRLLHDSLVEASNMLMYVELNGVHVDLQYLEYLEKEYGDYLEKLLWELRGMVGDDDYNPNSWQQVGKILKGKYKVRHLPNTQKETLKNIQERAAKFGQSDLYEFLRAHLDFKTESKSYGTYVKGTRKRLYKGRVHSTFLLHGTTTGRLASRNPNLQNVTRGSRLRRLFVSGSSETVLGQADYRQAELRVVCSLAGDAFLQSVFNDPTRNLHEEVGKQFYGPDFTKAEKEKYIRAKAVVFGLTYGREAFSLAAEHKMSEAEAQQYIDTFFNLIPQTVEWRKSVWDDVRNGVDLVSPFGNHRRFWLITKENKRNIEKEAYAFYPQNIVSNILLRSGVRLAKAGMRDMLRIPVHDAWVFECERDQQEDISRLVNHEMMEAARETFTEFVEFPVDIDFGRSWGDIS